MTEPTYRVVLIQGQEPAYTHWLYKAEARETVIQSLGSASILVHKNKETLSFIEACKEFEINSDIAEEIITLQMRINELHGKLM